jgi:dCMP deaminase
MTIKKTLILYVPVIHKGFLNFIEKNQKKIGKVFLISEPLVCELSEIKPDIASLDPKKILKFLSLFGIKNISVLTKKDISKLSNEKIMMINDEVSRNLFEKYLSKSNVEWKDIFLRWDSKSVLADKPLDEKVSTDLFDIKMMKEAYKEANNSTDWWRRVGAVLVKDGKIIIRGYNKAVPNDYTPYQVGNIRDYVKAGQKQELSPTIHAEQKIISEATRRGISLENTKLYITHFPCPMCTQCVMYSGIKECFFVEGASNLQGEKLLKLAGVKLSAVKI